MNSTKKPLVQVAVTMALSIALTGCLSAEPADIGTSTPDGSRPWVFDAMQQPVAPEEFPGEFPSFGLVKVTDRISGEPTLGVTRTGAIFYAAYDLEYWLPAADRPPNRPHTHFLRSSDGGEHTAKEILWQQGSVHAI